MLFPALRDAEPEASMQNVEKTLTTLAPLEKHTTAELQFAFDNGGYIERDARHQVKTS
jgi:hypothetical protein